MSMKYAEELKNYSRVTPQSRPIPGQEDRMVSNSAGGFVYDAGIWTMLERFLLIGTEGATYYIGRSDLTVANAKNVIKCIAQDGKEVVRRVVEISESGRAASNDPALFVLALAMSPDYSSDPNVRREAAYALPRVARTGSHLFTFVAEVDQLRGWGKFLRRAVAAWYTRKEVSKLGYQVVKYRNRRGWNHRDILRLAHPQAADPQYDALFRYIVAGVEGMNAEQKDVGVPHIVFGSEAIKHATTVDAVVHLISEFGLTHEMVPNEWKQHAAVWEALLYKMPIGAMVRNLGVMTSRGLVSPNSDASRYIVDTLLDEEKVRKSRIHPINVLKALKTYKDGKGFRGKLSWQPAGSVSDALEDTFYLSFGNVESTGKRFMLGVDVSGSMGWENVNTMAGLKCSELAAAMMMVTFRSERHAEAIGFARQLRPLNVSRHESLSDVLQRTENMTFGSTDCAAPMLHALKNGINADVFVIYTDNETWAGNIHPMQALNMYREKTGIDAKLVVVGMTSTGFSIADPLDPGTLDVVGFDAGFPSFLANFAAS